MSLPQPSATVSWEEALDFLAYALSTDARTSEVAWIVGDVGMGAPQETPFAYIAPRNDKIDWVTARGSTGGMAGGPEGVDDHDLLIPIVVAFEPHRYIAPVAAEPPAASPVSAQSLGSQPPFWEQPGYRTSMKILSNILAVLRSSPSNITLGGEIITSTIIETTYVRLEIDGKLYRAARLTLRAQQRRRRGT